MIRKVMICCMAAGLFFAITACQESPDVEETVTPTMTATETATPAPLCTPPPCQADEVYYCAEACPGGCGTTCATPTPQPGAVGTAPSTWDELAGWLGAAWAAQANPAAVRSALQAAGWQEGYEQWRGVDLDGDLRDEWVLVLFPPDTAPVGLSRPGNLWIIGAGGVLYRQYDMVQSPPSDTVAPDLIAIIDLTGDGQPELVVDEHLCGAHTCFGNYRILSSRGGAIDNVVQSAAGLPAAANVIVMSYPDAFFSDYQGDGVPDFQVHGGTFGSVGAGIARPYTEVWSWDGTAVTLAATLLDPTQYRHHILYEANQAYDNEALDEALLLYEQVINDAALIDPPLLVNANADVQGDANQFAAFRLILLDLRQGDSVRAAGRRDWLQQTYPNTPITQAAATLVRNWSGAENLPALCNVITVNLQTFLDPTGSLIDLGYANPALPAETVCPTMP